MTISFSELHENNLLSRAPFFFFKLSVTAPFAKLKQSVWRVKVDNHLLTVLFVFSRFNDCSHALNTSLTIQHYVHLQTLYSKLKLIHLQPSYYFELEALGVLHVASVQLYLNMLMMSTHQCIINDILTINNLLSSYPATVNGYPCNVNETFNWLFNPTWSQATLLLYTPTTSFAFTVYCSIAFSLRITSSTY